MLKFASRVDLLEESGRKVRQVHREEALRLHRNGQALHRNRGTFVRELILLDHHPKKSDNLTSSNSCRSSYKETLAGGNILTIETATTLPREVTTRPCATYKMKLIRRSLRPLYEAIIREATTPRV